MTQRATNLLWLKDMIEHLDDCRQQLEWNEDGDSVEVLTEAMLRDLESCKRLCEGLRRRSRQLQAA